MATITIQVGAEPRPAILLTPHVDDNGIVSVWSETKVLAYPAYTNVQKWQMLCEYEDGTLGAERIDRLRFADTLFGEHAWPEKDSKKV